MRRGFTWLELLIVIVVFFAIALLVLTFGFVSRRSELQHAARVRSRANLMQLYMFLSIYEIKYGSLPSVQFTNSPRTASADGCNLFSLYMSATNICPREILNLLQPHGIKLEQFSANPATGDFDKDHIGYRYNSSLTTLSVSNVPLMWEPVGSRNDMPVMTKRPVFTDGIHVLFTDGAVEWIPADKNGGLQTNGISADQWRLMAE